MSAQRAIMLYDRYTRDVTSQDFTPWRLIDHGGGRVEYKDERVEMNFYTRVTWCKDDYDTFTHEKVWVDGKLVHEDRYA